MSNRERRGMRRGCSSCDADGEEMEVHAGICRMLYDICDGNIDSRYVRDHCFTGTEGVVSLMFRVERGWRLPGSSSEISSLSKLKVKDMIFFRWAFEFSVAWSSGKWHVWDSSLMVERF